MKEAIARKVGEEKVLQKSTIIMMRRISCSPFALMLLRRQQRRQYSAPPPSKRPTDMTTSEKIVFGLLLLTTGTGLYFMADDVMRLRQKTNDAEVRGQTSESDDWRGSTAGDTTAIKWGR